MRRMFAYKGSFELIELLSSTVGQPILLRRKIYRSQLWRVVDALLRERDPGMWHLKPLGRLPVMIFKSLNDRQSEFRESSEPIMYMIILQYVNWEVSSDPKKIFSIMRIIISRVAVRSWHQSRDILHIKRDACLISCFTQWRSILASCLTIRFSFYPLCFKICGSVLLILHRIAWIWPVRFPKFVRTIALLWKPWPAVYLKISKCHIPGSSLS